MEKRLTFALAAIVCAEIAACTVETAPPPIRDDQTASPERDGGTATADPCATPSPGCPCADAGAEIDCGLVYRTSGSYVDCSPGTMTCGADGGWGACVGPSIYGQ